MKKKVTLSEQELRRLIRASLLEQDVEPAASIGIYSPIDEQSVISSDKLLTSLHDIVVQLSGLEVREAQYTGVQYTAFINAASRKLGITSPLGNWNGDEPEQSQFEIISAYLKFAVILLLEREDLITGPIGVQGSKSTGFVPYIKVDSDSNFYASSESVLSVTEMLDFINTKLFNSARVVNYEDQEFFDKLNDHAFVSLIANAKYSASKKDPSVAFKDFLTDKQREILVEIAREDLGKQFGPLKETWQTLNTATFENYFVLPVNIPNIWQAVLNNPSDPFYHPWRETWVVCNMINKGLALPGGASALAGMLYKASTSGLSAQSGTYRPDESKAAVMSTQPLNESRRILVSHEQLRRIVRAALHENLNKQHNALTEAPGDVVKFFKRLFAGGDETADVVRSAADLLGSRATTDALQSALARLKTSGLDEASIIAVRSSLENGMASRVEFLDNIAYTAPDVIDPGSISDVFGRPCIAKLVGLGRDTNPDVAEAARQILNNAARYAIAQDLGDFNATAEIATKIFKVINTLNSSQKKTLQPIINAATPNTSFFALPGDWDKLTTQSLPGADLSAIRALLNDLEKSYLSVGSGITSRSKEIAQFFASDTFIAQRAALEGVQSTTGNNIYDMLGSFGNLKYNPNQAGIVNKYVGALFFGGERYGVSLPTKLAAQYLASKLSKYPRLAGAMEWLMRSNTVRSIVAKQIAAYIMSGVLLGVGATGMSYEDSPLLFVLERLSDTNILSASLAEALIGVIDGLSDNEGAFIDDTFALALTADPEILKGILSGAVEHLVTGINIESGTFPDLQGGSKSSREPDTAVLDALASIARFFNYGGEAARSTAELLKSLKDSLFNAAETVKSATEVVNQTPRQVFDDLNSAMRSTSDATKQNINDALFGDVQYSYQPPPNSELLLKDYEKVRPPNSYTNIGLFSAVRDVDELKMLNILLDENLMLMPDDSKTFATIKAIVQGQETAIADANEPLTDEVVKAQIEMVKSLKALSAELNRKPAQTAP